MWGATLAATGGTHLSRAHDAGGEEAILLPGIDVFLHLAVPLALRQRHLGAVPAGEVLLALRLLLLLLLQLLERRLVPQERVARLVHSAAPFLPAPPPSRLGHDSKSQQKLGPGPTPPRSQLPCMRIRYALPSDPAF